MRVLKCYTTNIFFSTLLMAIIMSVENAVCEEISQVGNYETVTVEVKRHKRSVGVTNFKCNGQECSNGVCTPRTYEGPDPPEWCTRSQSHITTTDCGWSTTCWNNQCETKSDCDQTHDGGQGPKSIFNFRCYGETCRIAECQGTICSPPQRMSKTDFDNEFINKLPMCKDVEARLRRSIGTARALHNYCCDIRKRWATPKNNKAGISGTIRPKRR